MPGSLDKATVLVVEDEELVLKMVVKTLTWAGAGRILRARSAPEAWRLFNRADPAVDLVISDWNMPQVPGIELLRQIRRVAPALPFIMLTGRGTLESALEAKVAGVSAFVAKPFSPQTLAGKAVDLLQDHRRTEAAE